MIAHQGNVHQNHNETPLHIHQDEYCKEKKETEKKCWWGCGGIGTLTHCCWECKMVQPLWKIVWQFEMLNTGWLYDSAFPVLGICPERSRNKDSNKSMYTNVHSSTVHKGQKVKTSQMSIDRWKDQQTVVLSTQWNIFQPQKGMRYWHRLQHGWTAKILC